MAGLQDVSDLNRLFTRQHTSKHRSRDGPKHWIATPLLNVRLRRAMHRNSPSGMFTFTQKQYAEFGPADTDRVLQHRLKDSIKLARRA
jgi:hypothetical protein